MRVLLANKFLYPKGGAERAVLDLGSGLASRGHEVFWFGMAHPSNTVPSATSAVVRQRDYHAGGVRRYRDALAMIYSPAARDAFRRFIVTVKPDLVHIHNIYHQLTPSILDAAEQAGIPVVMTLHDYKLVCPRYDLLRHGKVCDACVEQGPTACLRHQCAGNWTGSLLLACESAFHRERGSYDVVQRFLTPSLFLRDVMLRGGWDAQRLWHVTNFTPLFAQTTPAAQEADPERFLFAGRLSAEKGVETLLQATMRLERGTLVICGAGPLENLVRRAVASAPAGRIQWKGHVAPDELATEIQRASFCVVPSEWFENAPFSVLEAMASARAVIASRIGGLPELIQSGSNGLLVAAGDVESWAAELQYAVQHPTEIAEMGRRGQDTAQQSFSFEGHLDSIELLYREVLA